MRNDSARKPGETGHDAPGTGLRVRPPAHPTAAQAASRVVLGAVVLLGAGWLCADDAFERACPTGCVSDVA